MAFFELNDIKRDRQPYKSDSIWHCKLFSNFSTKLVSFNYKYLRKKFKKSHGWYDNGNIYGIFKYDP